MTTQRAIRDAVQPLLLAIPGIDPGHVHRSPRRDIPDDDLPALCVFSSSDRPVDADADTQMIHERDYTLRVEVLVSERSEEDATDYLAGKVRKALLGSEWIGGASSIQWAGQTWDGVEGGDPLSGTALDFTFRYTYDPAQEA